MADGFCKGKSSWPELVGKKGEYAAATILGENPYVKDAPIVLEGTSVIENFRCDRVWVWVRRLDGTVYQTPTIG